MDDKHKHHDTREETNEYAAHQEHDQHEDHQVHGGHEGHQNHADQSSHKEGQDEHAGHTDHGGHEQMFRQRFWISSLISIPVLLYSPSIQNWLGFSMPIFPGSDLITPLLAVIIFFYGGLPFLKMAVPEINNRKPGMMTLISLAIGVAFIYSIVALFLPTESGFFWELVTLIDIMLLGHWIEMRSVRQASGALDALAKLLPDTAERIEPDGRVREVPVASLRKNDLLLVR
ncbi:MAG: heavy metal translocating P-type ATPase, partial [Anaerolineae bacterium]|nr:heavy metal translocating P-type ATPase [Anaerolineae bacterium]